MDVGQTQILGNEGIYHHLMIMQLSGTRLCGITSCLWNSKTGNETSEESIYNTGALAHSITSKLT